MKTLTDNGAENIVLLIQGALNSKGWIEGAGLVANVKTAAKSQDAA
jgi:hypothetical protein